MTKIFSFIKQRGYPALGALPSKVEPLSFAYPSRFFFTPQRDSKMNVLPQYRDVPFVQEKLKILKKLIKGDRDTIAAWEASGESYPLIWQVKEQLQKNSQMLLEIIGDSS